MSDDFFNPRWRQLYGALYSRPSDSKIFGSIDVDFSAARAYIETRASDGLHLTPTHLMIATLGRTIAQDVPEMNCFLRRGRAVPHDGVHVAVAVAIPDTRGTTSIVVHHANEKSLEEIAAGVRENVAGERRSDDERSGGGHTRRRQSVGRIPWPLRRLLLRFVTFAVTDFGLELPRFGLGRDSFGSILLSNIGVFGLDKAYLALLPIARIPAAMAIGAVEERAVVRDGQIVARPILPVTGVYDHRLCDGAMLGRLGRGIHRRLGDPKLLEGPVPYRKPGGLSGRPE